MMLEGAGRPSRLAIPELQSNTKEWIDAQSGGGLPIERPGEPSRLLDEPRTFPCPSLGLGARLLLVIVEKVDNRPSEGHHEIPDTAR